MTTILPTSPASLRDYTVRHRLQVCYDSAKAAKRARYQNWERNYRLMANQHANSFGGTSWMPSPRDSEIYPILSSLVAWMVDQDTQVSFTPAADPESSIYDFTRKLADDLTSVVYSTWRTEDFDEQIDLTLWDAFLYGTGIIKSSWDNTLDDGYGNATIRRVDPWRFYPDPNATSLKDAEYLVETYSLSYEQIERRWPDKAHEVIGGSEGNIRSDDDRKPQMFPNFSRSPMANPGSIPLSGTFGNLGGSGIGNFSKPNRSSGDQDTFDLPRYHVYEFWFRENTEVTPPDSGKDSTKPKPDDETLSPDYAPLTESALQDKWRIVVVCNNVILMDELAEDLWSHGQHPYEDFRFDNIGEFWGIAIVDHLAQPQEYINRLLTALQQNAELTGNPVFVEAAASGTTRVPITNRPGQRITLNSPAAMQNSKPFWLTPPSMPPQVMDLVNFWISRLENTSGLSALQKGAAPTQRNAESVINTVSEAAFVRVRHAVRNLEQTLRRVTSKTATLISDNYTEARILPIISPDGQSSALALTERHFYGPNKNGSAPLKFMLQINAGSVGPTSRQARMSEADKLFALGIVDDQYVLNAHQIRDPHKILTRLYEKREKGVLGGGKPKLRA